MLSSVVLVFARALMGKVNLHGYLISQFHTHEIHENLIHAKNMHFTTASTSLL